MIKSHNVIKQLFDDSNEEFDNLNDKFKHPLSKKLNDSNEEFDILNEKFKCHKSNEEFDTLNQRFNNLDQKFHDSKAFML